MTPHDLSKHDAANSATQEIRVAAVLNGGVSLAVWMSGVTLELHHLALASRGMGEGRWSTYSEVLKLMQATARVDVIAGTSAGGLNGAFLALGLARCRDFGLLRDVWMEEGSLEKLLRPALEKDPPSPLRGDQFFLPRIKQALADIVGTGNRELADPDEPDRPPVELMLTGTLWDGRESTFSDDMGVSITERDYNATFRFANRVPVGLKNSVGDLDSDDTAALIGQLAEAARCTSSFPAAFEPHYVTAKPDAIAPPGRWASSAGEANFANSQYVLDGGVLLNKPIRPALDAIYRQTAEKQVRRVLAYVVPDTGEKADDGTGPKPVGAPAQPPTPVAGDVLLSVLTRLKSTDSVSRELSEIRDNNAAVAERRRARSRLAQVMPKSGVTLSEQLYKGYRDERRESACQAIGRAIAAGQASPVRGWSVQELTDTLRQVARKRDFTFLPQPDIGVALAADPSDWRWGQTTLGHLADMAADVLRRTLDLAPLKGAAAEGVRGRIVAARGALGEWIAHIADYDRSLDEFWLAAARRQSGLGPIPPRKVFRAVTGSASARNLDDLETWLTQLVPEWDRTPPETDEHTPDPAAVRRAGQQDAALHVARVLHEAKADIAAVVHQPNPATNVDGADEELTSLTAWLVGDARTDADVLQRMLRLEIVDVASGSAFTQVEQQVELVQVSCTDRDRITGMQLHHFGAFYRAPWRVNDWIEGRHDGARQVVRFLLSPERLRQCGYTPADAADVVLALRKIAVPAGSPHAGWLAEQWRTGADDYRKEVELALQRDAGATALDAVATALAKPIMLESLPGDLEALAGAIRAERTDAPADSAKWLAAYDAAKAAPGGLAAEQLWELFEQMALVGQQKLIDDVGSDTFALTASHAAVVVASTFASPPKLGKFKPVRLVMSALRGYAAMVWTMVMFLTRGSAIGARAVELAVAAGAVLLAVTILVPAVPIGVTLVGVGLVLAGLSASALRTKGATDLGLRLAQVLALVLAALALLVWRDIHDNGTNGQVLPALIKFAVGLVIVLLGWYVAGTDRVGRLSSLAVRTLAGLAAFGTALLALRLFLMGKTFAGRTDRWFGLTLLAFELAVFAVLELQLQSRSRRQRTGAGPEPGWLDRGLTYGEPLLLALALVSTCISLGGETTTVLATTLGYAMPVALLGLVLITVRSVQLGRWRGVAAICAPISATLALIGVGMVSIPIRDFNDFLHPWVWGVAALAGFGALAVAVIVRPAQIDADT